MFRTFLLTILALHTPTIYAANIDAVFVAQTHVQRTSDTHYVGLVSGREALVKAHVVAPGGVAAPQVQMTLVLNGQTRTQTLSGPSVLPSSVPSGPGQVQHRYNDSFTAIIPADWIQPGLRVTVTTPSDQKVVNNLRIGAPTTVVMTMFDMHFFEFSDGDYTNGWEQELAAKWPVSELLVRRTPEIVFSELVVPARAGAPAVRVTSKDDYTEQTGLRFDGEQAATAQWNGALRRAAGKRGRISLYYSNIYGVAAGGQAGGFSGVGNGRSAGILHHELGHALSLPHWGNSSAYPYKGDMFGISAPAIFNATHAGPTWAFDPPSGKFIPPTVQANRVAGRAVVGTYKADPMQGGGTGDQERGFILRHFSDFSVKRMRDYLEGHVVVFNEAINSYASWNQASGSYAKRLSNNGVEFPIVRDVEVISVMAAISASSPDVNMVYPPIGPYKTGVIELFDPASAADRDKAAEIFCPSDGCDVSLRFVQGGQWRTVMLDASWDPTKSPTDSAALSTRAVNLLAADGKVKYVELLLTPDAEKNGLPPTRQILASWGERPLMNPGIMIQLLDEAEE